MNKIILLPIMASALCLGSVSAVKQSANYAEEERDTRIIVQLNDDVEKYSVDALVNKQNYIIRQIRETVTPNVKLNDRFTSVFNGFTLDVPSGYVSHIRALPGIKRVNYNNVIYKTDHDEAVTLVRRNAVNISEATENVSKVTMQIPDGTSEGEGVLIGILDTGGYIYYDENGNKVQHDIYTELPAGTKLKIADEAALKALEDGAPSFHGKYDKNHSTYWNNKVPFYYDYGGDTNERNAIGKEDYDVFSKDQEHGTHVASIAGGNSPYYKGIAPKAQLAVMKVFTCYTPTKADANEGYTPSAGAYPDALLKALEDCAVLGVDVVNMSLGSALNDFDNDSIVQNVITNLKNRGIYVNHAAGNEGKYTFKNSAYENWTTDNVETGILSSYSNNPNTIEIAAAQPDRQFYESAFMVGGNTVSFRDQIESYTNSEGDVTYDPEHHLTDLIKDGTHPDGVFEWFKVPGLGDDSDYDGLEDDCLDNKIAIIDRGDITFVKKITNAIKYGAIAVGIIDNDPSNTDFSFRMDLSGWNPGLPVVSILYRDKPIFDNATEFTARIVVNEIADNPSKRMITDFSSDGATFDLQLKPDIATPGQNILGAINEETNSYEYYDGTSMATPNYCGVVALMMGDHLDDQAYRKTINARLMSTAEPMRDGRNVAEGQEKAFTSVRKQGAGLVNGNAAMNSKVYLDGSTTSNLSNYAKIALGNNAKIKEGIVDLSFSVINETNAAINYTATTYIYRPDLVELDSENFPEFEGVKFQSTDNHLIAKVSNNVTANAGTSVIDLPEYTISNEEKGIIDDNFPNGTYIEGFVVLEAEGQFKLSIPFLGFYGDYSKGIPVEPFKFERDPNQVYGSDLVNSIVRKWKNLLKADFASDWLLGNYDKFADVSVDEALLNEKSFRDLVDGNTNNLIPATTNPYTGETDPNGDIYAGNNGFCNTMIITQFVMRSVATNTITITNKANGNVVLVDHMFDDLYGATEDDEGNDIAWPLYKSEVDINQWSSNLVAHRAYSLIPLYEMDDDQNKKGEFPDGEYTINFSYTLAAGGTYEKNYTLHIDSKAPTIKSLENVTKDGVDYIRVRYNEEKMSYFIYGGFPHEALKDENGYYYDVLASEATNGFFLRAYDYSNAITNTIFDQLSTGNFISLTNSKMNATYSINATVTDNSAIDKTVQLGLKQNGGNVPLTGTSTICLELFAGMDPQYVRVYEVSGSKETLVSSTVSDGFVSFTINSAKFHIMANEYTAVESVSLNKNKIELKVGETYQLNATVLPAAADQTITWSSSKGSVASVKNGLVTAKKAGTAVITATSPEFKEASCEVTVASEPVTLSSIAVNGAKAAFEVGDTFSSEGLVVTATYSDNSTKDVTSQATVDSSAVNLAAAGTYTVTVTFEGKSASYQVTVTAKESGGDTSEGPSESVDPGTSSQPDKKKNNGCGGSIASSMALLLASSLAGILAISAKKKRK